MYPNIYITTNLQARPLIRLRDVQSFARGARILRTGTYRDTGWSPPTASLVAGTTTSNVLADGVLLAPQPAATVTAQATNWAAQFRHIDAPDEMLHVEPRYSHRRETGYLFALTATPIAPEPTLPTNYATTVALTTGVFTTDGPHQLLTDDEVIIAAVSLPTGASASTTYQVLVLSPTTLLLRSGSTILVPTTVGAGVRIVVRKTDNYPRAVESDVIFIPDAWQPHIAFENPET